MEPEARMNEELELALAYWRTMAPQPKAIVYANAIQARLSGTETKELVIDHELTNAITRGASIARGRGIQSGTVKLEQKAEAKVTTTEAGKAKGKGSRKAKGADQASGHPLKS
jgi:hypothetical protein